jgi:hypothetical protein
MFEVGDRVVCIDDKNEICLTLGKVYRVKEVLYSLTNVYLSLDDTEFEYNIKRFISIEKDRKRKLYRIKSKI